MSEDHAKYHRLKKGDKRPWVAGRKAMPGELTRYTIRLTKSDIAWLQKQDNASALIRGLIADARQEGVCRL